MERGKGIILGFDMGGSNVRGGVFKGPKMLGFSSARTPKTREGFNNLIYAMLKKNSSGRKIKGIGVAVAGVIKGTKVLKSPNIKYLNNFDFASLGLGKIKVDNDARAFLRAEAGPLKAGRVLGITIGTGIGRAFAEAGKVLKIKKFEYPEKWEREYQEIRDRHDDKELAEFLGQRIRALATHYRATSIILGGGVMTRRGFFEKIKTRLGTKVIKARFGQKAGVRGAALLWK